jgi:radical SAM superfamily enzyme YgiQ (UPF0313 family)
MKRILLINPPWYSLQGAGFGELPLGLSCLASYLNTRGFDAYVYNADYSGKQISGYKSLYESYSAYLNILEDLDHPLWQGIIKKIIDFNPQAVGINLKTGSYKSATNIARLVKRSLPGVHLICGGTHATLLPKEVIAEGSFDFVIKGEGEETFLELLNTLKENKEPQEIKNITFRQGEKIIDNPLRPFIKDLDILPPPERDKLLNNQLYSSQAKAILMTSRGCPYECIFCASEKIWQRKVRFRSPGNVIEEIFLLKDKYKANFIKIRDDAFTLNRQRAIEICKAIEGRDIYWQCDTRADILDEELVKFMKRAGCIAVSVGLESGSDRILTKIKKGESAQDIQRGVSLLNRFGINVGLFVMIGFPTETEEEIWQTLEFAKKLKANHIIAGVVTPYPGTPIFEEAKELGFKPDDPYWKAFFHQSPEMGLFKDKARFKEIEKKFFEKVEQYNNSFLRRGTKLIFSFLNDPNRILYKLKAIKDGK